MTFTRKPVTLMCVQPCIQYYAWQIEVMLTNFKELNIESQYNIHCLFAYNKNEEDWQIKVETIEKVEAKFTDIARFFYYEDTRKDPYYISSVRPNILKQHFYRHPELSQDSIFYHDCDIVFTKYPDFLLRLTQRDTNWYVSDTSSYIGYNYIKSKGEDVLDKMCDIVGINKSLVERKEYQSGGAQYLLKGVDWMFFDKMEKDCERLYKEITELNDEKVQLDRHTMPEGEARQPYHPLQIWCADMWAMLWGGWMRGYHTNIIPELDFCWATDPIENWDKKYIFHNAGVTPDRANEMFYKGYYIDKLPYTVAQTYSEKWAANNYYKLIQSIKTVL
jgi:hypothetical protein